MAIPPPEETEEQSIVSWARLKIDEQERYRRRQSYYVVFTLLSFLASFVPITYYVAPVIPWSFLVPYAIFLTLFLLKDYLFKSPNLTPSEIYTVCIVDVKENSQGQLDGFHDAVADAMSLVNEDMKRYKHSLAASRTYKMLRDLRSVLLRYATVVEDEKKGKPNPKAKADLEFAIGHAIVGFYRFENIEEYVNMFIPSELKNTSGIPESKYALSRRRTFTKFLKGWYRLPVPANFLLVELIFLSAIVAFPFSTWFPVLRADTEIQIRVTAFIAVAIGILAVFAPSLRKWFQEKLG